MMADIDAIELLTWPEVPEDQRPKTLYVNYSVPENKRETLASMGWEVRDIRLLAPQESLKGKMEGIRTGSIVATETVMLKYAEIETRYLGMVGNKVRSQDEKETKKAQSVAEMLSNFSDGKEEIQTAEPFAPVKRRGRIPKAVKEALDNV